MPWWLMPRVPVTLGGQSGATSATVYYTVGATPFPSMAWYGCVGWAQAFGWRGWCW